jgi:predicted ATPase
VQVEAAQMSAVTNRRMIGRASEMTMLNAALGTLMGDVPAAAAVPPSDFAQPILFYGEAGFGKTLLMDNLQARAHAH